MPCPYVRETITRLPCLTLGMRSGTTCGGRRVDDHSGDMLAPYVIRGAGVLGLRRRWMPACTGIVCVR